MTPVCRALLLKVQPAAVDCFDLPVTRWPSRGHPPGCLPVYHYNQGLRSTSTPSFLSALDLGSLQLLGTASSGAPGFHLGIPHSSGNGSRSIPVAGCSPFPPERNQPGQSQLRHLRPVPFGRQGHVALGGILFVPGREEDAATAGVDLKKWYPRPHANSVRCPADTPVPRTSADADYVTSMGSREHEPDPGPCVVTLVTSWTGTGCYAQSDLIR